MSSATTLSKHDFHVFGALFDPESSLSSTCQIKESESAYYSPDTLTYVKRIERQTLASVDTATPPRADILNTIQALSELIKEYPEYASAYNNRAEARRLSYSTEELMHLPNILNAIFTDLGRAISLATPKDDLNTVSAEDAVVLAAAHTHRASLLYSASQMNLPESVLSQVESMAGQSREQLEEHASKNFAAGGRFGNKLAKQLAVKTNPYAKLCSGIIKEAMRNELNATPGVSYVDN
ncbi:hypothetical protein KC340_g6417 [Hortaea werneckii]|nr:hypothetical protein KC342_g6704 [Hortaea werneckii]KAI7098553.1 hypothetical protein KC339_g8872 [Hortaea werneckii]KAI7240695.1 hypothetical protein KC365_g3742 [Hortaea werneckii]KAI7324393.1 hypothetical protein KC340_g6417 [Hortaea werneckii]KAI7399867.1 hypothetical protein KC328_g3841 [Hortaea werneckii]